MGTFCKDNSKFVEMVADALMLALVFIVTVIGAYFRYIMFSWHITYYCFSGKFDRSAGKIRVPVRPEY
jgi:hypothetical protein